MAQSPDEHNQAKAKYEKAKIEYDEDMAKFERDKARKETSRNFGSPWTTEAWNAPTVESDPRYPIIITDSQGVFATPQELQKVAGLLSLPEVHWTTTAAWSQKREEEADDTDDIPPAEKVRYSDVGFYEWCRIKESTDGEELLVWFRGSKRIAWRAHAMKQQSGDVTII